MIRKGLTISKFRAMDESGIVEIVFFNSPFIKDVFHTGAEFRFYGKLSIAKKTLQLTNPKYEPYIDGLPLPDFVPIYPSVQGVSSKFIEKITAQALDSVIREIVDPLPDAIRLSNSLFNPEISASAFLKYPSGLVMSIIGGTKPSTVQVARPSSPLIWAH